MRSFALRTCLCIVCVACVQGCRVLSPKRPPLDYRTVVETPVRNEQVARENNGKAIDALERGKLDKAERLAQEALVADVTFGPAHNTLGRVYFERGNLYLAAWEFEYAASVMPEQPEPVNNLGLVFEAAERLDDAVAQYEQAHALAPDVSDYLGNLVRARRRRGDSVSDLRPLIQQLVFVETRPEWAGWARELLQRSYAESNSPTAQVEPIGPGMPSPAREIPPPSPKVSASVE